MDPKQEHFILFDFDGVIVPSFDASYLYVARFNPGLTRDQYLALFEGNIYDTSNHLVWGSDEEFWTQYIERMLATAPVPGIVLAITDLESRYSLAVVSSSMTNPIRTYLTRHGLADHFVEIMGMEIHQSKIEKIKMVFEKYAINSNTCIFITDTLGDMHEAAHMNVRSIGVTWGFHSAETLKQGNPTAIVDTPGLLVEAIDRHFASTPDA